MYTYTMQKNISYPKKAAALKTRHAAMTERQKADLSERRLQGAREWRKKVKQALEAMNPIAQ